MSNKIGVVAEATSSVGQIQTICIQQGVIPRFATRSTPNLLAGKMGSLTAFELPLTSFHMTLLPEMLRLAIGETSVLVTLPSQSMG